MWHMRAKGNYSNNEKNFSTIRLYNLGPGGCICRIAKSGGCTAGMLYQN
jgi:hypothetical protein